MKPNNMEFLNTSEGWVTFSEQITDAVHHDFTQKWANYEDSEHHSQYEKRRLNSVVW